MADLLLALKEVCCPQVKAIGNCICGVLTRKQQKYRDTAPLSMQQLSNFKTHKIIIQLNLRSKRCTNVSGTKFKMSPFPSASVFLLPHFSHIRSRSSIALERQSLQRRLNAAELQSHS